MEFMVDRFIWHKLFDNILEAKVKRKGKGKGTKIWAIVIINEVICLKAHRLSYINLNGELF
ncbi:hypothetical protein [Desulfosporosinus sp. Sb-LF]|uniref:hypothetical protein n=1 Tax=Desulfosporosinus sp. Sb-LF TaxID=2560027 RepID=UPI00107F982B|nr:hypothetical protein [Desulfosporosinus sp. Sb-LF]TGE32670.1 hypothetical protein E4K68_10875 [Desulfosporosinus sp. Sb-LF]